jgi:hypothetical protein
VTIDPERINRHRARVVWGIRGVAATAGSLGAYLVLKRLIFGAGIGDFQMALQSFMETGETHSFSRGLAMVAVGAVLGILSRPLARWIIAMPPAGCPRCGHLPAPGAAGPCPECGLPRGPRAGA